MKTSEEMYEYCVRNGYGRGLIRNWSIKHFKVLENNLRDDEEVLMTFIGLYKFRSIGVHDNTYAYAITNKRMIFGQKKIVGENFKTVLFDRVNDISSSTGAVFGVVTIDTLGEIFNVGVAKKTAENICGEAHRIILNIRSDKANHNKESKINSNELRENPVLEIRKYKKLLDDGVISEEDFENKKKQLLGI